MTWPTTTISTTHLDAGTDSPASARADIKQMADNVNAIKDEFQDGDGALVASALQNVSEDTTPELGGNLDGSGYTVTADDFIGDLNGAVRFTARNKEGSTITAGQVVYIKGVIGGTPTVALADASDSAKMQAFGVALDDISDNTNGEIVTFGTLSSIDTSAFTEGDTLYVSTTPGALTATAPAGESNLIQNMGRCQKSHATLGSIKVGGAGRTNATPNLDAGKMFVGNASNQSVSQTLSGDATIDSSASITLANTAVTPGSYTAADITVDSKGRITSASSGSAGASIGETCVFEVNATGGGNYGGEETSPYRRTIFNLTDPSSYYSLSGYQLTLPAGSYTLEHFKTVIDATDSHTWNTILYNATTSSTIATSDAYNEIGTSGEGFYAFSAIFTLATSTVIEIRGSGSYYIPTQHFKITHIA